MPDIGEKATEREYRRLRAKIRDVYQQAYEEIYQKNLDFVRRHEQKERQYRQMVAEGRISQADFDAWMRGQVFQGRMWEAQRKQMQETLYHADEIALQMVNDSRYSVFADNANYIGFTLEKGARVMTSFGLYDADSVRRLIKDEPYLLPPRKLAGRDKSYQWYNRQIQTAITQGIIQGEPLKDIAKRIGKQTGETDMNAMLRNARTMQTGAQNAGRIEGMHQAQRLGIKLKKQWMATLDSHTRDAHQALDGQIAEVDKPFKSELGPIMYPGDQAANPANIWNCRCTLVSVYPEYPDEMMKRRDNETGEIIDNMTYREWEEMKRSRRAEPEPEKPEMTTQEAIDDYDRRLNEIDESIKNAESEYQDLMCQQMMAFGTPEYDELTQQLEEMDKKFAESYAEADRLRKEKREYLTQVAGEEIKRIFGEINGPHSMEDDLWATNRITADDSRSYNNCGYCALAFDARRRGIDCKAPYIFGANDRQLSGWWKDFSFETTGQYYPQDAARTIKETAEGWGPGARGVVAIDHNEGMGHYFSFEVGSDGICRFVDAQSGVSDASDAFDSASPGSVRFGRTDDKELTKSASVYIEKGGWGSDKYS